MNSKIYIQSGNEIIRALGKQYALNRKRLGFTQKAVSSQSGISVFTISSFENGSATGITLSSFIKLLRAIEMLEEIEKILPKMPESPKELYKKQLKMQG